MSTLVCVYMCVCMCVCTCVWECSGLCECVYMCVCKCVYQCVCVCMCVCVCVCVCVRESFLVHMLWFDFFAVPSKKGNRWTQITIRMGKISVMLHHTRLFILYYSTGCLQSKSGSLSISEISSYCSCFPSAPWNTTLMPILRMLVIEWNDYRKAEDST